MKRQGEAERFASRLRALRERSDYSYEVLAQKTGISRSSLHRYCTGSSVPQDYGIAHRIATVCGASPAELRELHRLWALADTERAESGVWEGSRESEEVERTRETGEGGKTEEIGETGEEGETGRTDGTANVSEAASDTPGTPVSEPSPPAAPTPSRRHPRGRRRVAVTTSLAALALALSIWGITALSSPDGSPTGPAGATQDGRLLFSEACGPVVSMGQQDACVREVQSRLRSRGARIGVDSSFGPETLRRVTAFQVLSGITPNGVVAEPTKKALYESTTRMETWSQEKVRQRIREVFTEAPDDAVSIADCQSFLDPLHVLPNTNGTRNWGLFQISDARLRELGGTPRKALDPEWNIQAAHTLWSRDRDFHDWPHCARALKRS
ncbi:helix-turn-helix domain-containing protein [Streptomyces sp. NPDC101115]|uniref:helix-turn-helix domain-containing protein n=1 Tax=Streptomyces sp. NPDC101115 TaxID=3366106 RepID=UPI00380ADBDA